MIVGLIVATLAFGWCAVQVQGAGFTSDPEALPDYTTAFLLILAGLSFAEVFALADALMVIRGTGRPKVHARVRVTVEAALTGVVLAGYAVAFGYWPLALVCVANVYVVATVFASRE